VRSPRVLVLVVVALLGISLPAASAVPLGNGREATGGGFHTDNVEWLGNIPLTAGTAGARIVGKHMYVTDTRGLTIFDISNPQSPVPTGFAPMPQTPVFVQEDLETNGKLAVLATNDLTESQGVLFVYDVQNKNVPKLVGTPMRNVPDHTISCLLDCTWVYGSDGTIVDLRDPAKPVVATNKWFPAGGFGRNAHDLTEIEPGLVMVASNPILYLDARANPLAPKLIGMGLLPDGRYIHGVSWPRGGKDKFLLAGGETFGDCKEKSGAFNVLHAGGWDFSFSAEYRVPPATPGALPSDGGASRDFYCAHWFSEHPKFHNGGVVAMGWYQHGVRFLDVHPSGKVTEKGWFIGHGAETSAAYWPTDDIVYVLDYSRGLDILRFHDRPKGGVKQASAAARVPLQQRKTVVRDQQQTPGGPFACPIPVAAA
jgi:hypothetical protein